MAAMGSAGDPEPLTTGSGSSMFSGLECELAATNTPSEHIKPTYLSLGETAAPLCYLSTPMPLLHNFFY